MGKIWIQNQTVFYIMYSTSPPTLHLAYLLIFILLEFHFHIGESPWPFQLCWSVSTHRHVKVLVIFGRKMALPSFAITIGATNLKLPFL